MGSGDVVEQHAVGNLAGEPEHPGVERRHDDLRPALPQAYAEAEPPDLPEIALEGDGLPGQALAHQGDVFAHHRDRPFRAGLAVLPQDAWRGDAQSQPDVRIGTQGLQGRGGHRGQRRRADLNGDDSGAEAHVGRHRRDGRQQREGIRAGGFGGPQRAVAHRLGQSRDLGGRARAEYREAPDRDTQRCSLGHASRSPRGGCPLKGLGAILTYRGVRRRVDVAACHGHARGSQGRSHAHRPNLRTRSDADLRGRPVSTRLLYGCPRLRGARPDGRRGAERLGLPAVRGRAHHAGEPDLHSPGAEDRRPLDAGASLHVRRRCRGAARVGGRDGLASQRSRCALLRHEGVRDHGSGGTRAGLRPGHRTRRRRRRGDPCGRPSPAAGRLSLCRSTARGGASPPAGTAAARPSTSCWCRGRRAPSGRPHPGSTTAPADCCR